MRIPAGLLQWTGVILSAFVLLEVNYPNVRPQTQLAFFAMLGLVMVFLKTPAHPRFAESRMARFIDLVLVAATLLVFGYVIVQSEQIFSSLWLDGMELGNRAGSERQWDYTVAFAGLLLVLEASRRTIGWTLPILSLLFIAYAAYGAYLPDWLFPHRGYSWERIASQTFLHSQGVFGVALRVMFTYVFLFVLFGALLEKSGATQFIIQFARKLFQNSAGGPAKVSVISSGMMGSLSGSAVANTATTGTFTIPMMRSGGFSRTIAAAIEAAASSGGALVPPVMGAGAYMMLEIVDPPVTFLEIIRAALIPAILYYFALILIVHFRAKGIETDPAKQEEEAKEAKKPLSIAPGIVFFGSFAGLILFLLLGYTPFRAVSLALIAIVVLGVWKPETRLTPKSIFTAFHRSSASGVSLIAAACCVGIIVGVVTLTGVGGKLPGTLLPLAEQSLILALVLLMVSTIILGMGLPSAVCYLLMATLVGPVLGGMGVVPLSAHLFIFYFGMMSMVTPPVALAAYTSGTIAGADIMKTGFAAFRFSLVGFALPYSFVLRPELLMLNPEGAGANLYDILQITLLTAIGVTGLAASVAGYWFHRLLFWQRLVLFIAAFVLLLAPPNDWVWILHGACLALTAAIAALNKKADLSG